MDWSEIWKKFPYRVVLEDLPKNDEHEERYGELHPCIKIHASSEESLKNILERGLKPMGDCPIWPLELSEEQVRQRFEVLDLGKQGKVKISPEFMKMMIDNVMECRAGGVYFWDDIYEGTGQGLVTVGYLKEGDPVIFIIDTSEKKLERDPEIESDRSEEATAMVHKGDIPPEDIQCVCRLKEELKPSIGSLMCRMKHTEEECPKIDFENLFEEFNDPSNWICACKKPDIKKEFEDKVAKCRLNLRELDA